MSQIRMDLSFENEYRPDFVSAPGETLQEILDERRMTQTELAERLGLAHKTVNEIIRGKAPITPETALALEIVLGIPASFWNRYEAAFRDYLARKAGVERLSAAQAWLRTLPWRHAANLHWLEIKSTVHEQALEVLRFFGVASPEQYEEVYGSLAVQWRRSAKLKSDPHSIAFWLRRGELEVQKLIRSPDLLWGDYDPRKFDLALREARAITWDLDANSCLERLKRLCAPAGVAVVFIPDIRGTRASGATRWLSPNLALIQLSFRYKRSDTFWFDFMHEGAHVLKHSKRKLFLEWAGTDQEEREEWEANRFAEDTLIPPKEWTSFVRNGKPSMAQVEAFAKRTGIEPAIVVGRLRKENVIGHSEFGALIQYYRVDID